MGAYMEKKEVLKVLERLKAETFRLYEVNGKQAYDSGVYAGVKWAIEEIEKI